ncbi:MAG: calcium-binding protein [Pseudomonadota bacterium]
MSDVIKGTTGDDEMVGSVGSDNLNGGNGNDTVRGGAGDDTVRGGNGDDDVNGGSGDDDVRGGFGDDDVKGGEGNDTVNGGRDSDVMAGGSGEDIFVFDGTWGENAGDDIIIDFEDGVDQIQLLNSSIQSVSQVDDAVVIALATGGSLTIENLSIEQLDSLDFVGGDSFFDDVLG